jgi:replicative DNA helicase
VRKRSEVTEEERPRTEFKVPVDTTNEAIVVASALVVDEETRKRLLARIPPESFFLDAHRALWWALGELRKRRLALSIETLQSLVGDRVRASYLAELLSPAPSEATLSNLDFHVTALQWDRKRSTIASGALSSLLEAFSDTAAAPERVRALARSVAEGLEGFADKQYVYDPAALVAETMADIRKRIEGKRSYPYGIPGLDYFEADLSGKRKRRMIPGAAPGQITFVTGVPRSGKSTFTAHVALGQMKQERRTAYGAWEVQAPMTTEILACIHLGWPHSDILDPEGAPKDIGHESLVTLEETMHEILKWVVFIKNPFRRHGGEKKSNDRNLDLVQAILADSGAEVFIADMWRRCLVSSKPDEEEEAIFRQQAMLEEMGVHGFFVHQQTHKDMKRRDKRPTTDGMKGSGAFFEAADSVIGIHRAALWKDLEDDTMEALILKQRHGGGPFAIEFKWNAQLRSLKGGRSIKFDFSDSEGNEATLSNFKAPGVTGERRGGKR